MAARTGSGTAGSWVDVGSLSFPAVPYGSGDFNPRCKPLVSIFKYSNLKKFTKLLISNV